LCEVWPEPACQLAEFHLQVASPGPVKPDPIRRKMADSGTGGVAAKLSQ